MYRLLFFMKTEEIFFIFINNTCVMYIYIFFNDAILEKVPANF